MGEPSRLIHESWIKDELSELYGSRIVTDINRINTLYAFYDGAGQTWETAEGLAYTPTKAITNLVKKLIKSEARFMVSIAPEIKIIAEDEKNRDAAKEIETWITGVLNANSWQRKLIQAVRDCFIGKRVALKISGGEGKALRLDFRPAQEFVFDVVEDDTSSMKKIVFFYQVMNEKDDGDKSKQRIWRQRYELKDGKCILDEGLYDGNGKPVNVPYENFPTGLQFIPCRVIINDGLTGDLEGESDVELLLDNQDDYNHTKSDDRDALRFNMFPMWYTKDASQNCASEIKVSPGAYVDLATDPAASQGGRQVDMGILENTFSYDERVENHMNRTKNDMYELLSIPNVSLEQLKGLAQSGKGIEGIYKELTARCEEKWAEGWDDAIRWMVETLILMARAYKVAALPEIEYNIKIDHMYPVQGIDEDERINDLAEVRAQARSRKAYVEKWQKDADAQGELNQIKLEQTLLEDAYAGAVDAELAQAQLPETPEATQTEEDSMAETEADVTDNA